MNRQTETRSTQRDLEKLEQLELQLIEEKKNEINIGRVSNMEERINRLKYTFDIFNEKEKTSYIKELMSHAFHIKSDVYQDRNVAETQYKNILKLNRDNPEAAYRYAFLQYDKNKWLVAITHFQHAIKSQTYPRRNINFPLSEDQIIKAKLYIGYCAAQIAKEALNEANTLNKESLALPVEGISIEKLLDNLKAELNKTEFMMITKEKEKGISKEEYYDLIDNLEEEQLVLSFVDAEPFIQKGDSVVTMSGTLSILRSYCYEVKGTYSCPKRKCLGLMRRRLRRISYSQQVSRLNAELRKCGYAKTLITKKRNDPGYKIESLDFYIIAREDHHL